MEKKSNDDFARTTKTILWSGGIDSTVLAYQYLKSGWDLKLISLSSKIIAGNDAHIEARQKILKTLKSRFKKRSITHKEIAINIDDFVVGDDASLPQPVVWVTHASFYLEPEEDVYVGWIGNDQVWSELDKVEKIFYSIQSMLGKTGKLIYDYKSVSKHAVILKAKEFKILHVCWWCEAPGIKNKKFKACGTCESCLTHGAAIWKIDQLAKHHTGEKSDGDSI